MRTVAALFVDPRGPYAGMKGVEMWDAARDARRYAGEHPVVCHPPCQLWTNLAGHNFRRWGGAHNRPGNDGGCFAAALRSVLSWGGVLEHPAFSHAWGTFALPVPAEGCWTLGELSGTGERVWVTELWQAAYGNPASKRTWLLYCGFQPPLPARWGKREGTHQVGWFDRNKPTLGKRQASLTPPEFARYLVSLARRCQDVCAGGERVTRSAG